MNYMGRVSFEHIHPKIIKITFSFPEFAPAYKKVVYSINSFLRYIQFQSTVTRLTKAMSDHAHNKIFWPTFYLCEFVSTCKKWDYFIDLFWRYDWLKNQFDWVRKFWLVSQEQKFSQIWDFCRNTENSIIPYYRSNSVKINDQMFQ